MRYMLMIHDEETAFETRPRAEQEQIIQEYAAFTAELRAAGALRNSDRLKPVATATTVRLRDGELLVTDGPFTETKEQFGGYYEIEAPDLDAAIKWAAKIPSARFGSIEIRPVWEHEDF